jgi:pyrroline-5-carboxylate reductase
LVQEGISALAEGNHTKKEQLELATELLSAIGKVVVLEEKQLDAVTGLSGSGPAYVLEFIDALAAGGVKEGLRKDVALQLAAQTVLGTAKLFLMTGEHPASLRDKVTSPGGTTIAGLYALESGNFRATVMNAVATATKRSKELSQTDK